MDELKDKIAKNLVDLRTQAHLTQLQLAEMLNYSDKAVSKWERGEAIPDLRVLIRLTEIYGVTLDDLVKGTDAVLQTQPKKITRRTRVLISALSAGLVWFIATGLFLIFYFIPATAAYAYLVFAVAPLPMAIVLTVFSVKWGNRITNAVACSMIVWFSAMIFYIFVSKFAPEFDKIVYIFIAAAVFEALIILWFAYRRYAAKRINKNVK